MNRPTRAAFAVLLSGLLAVSCTDSRAPLRRSEVFYTGLEPGVSCYRIPALATAPDGTLLAVADQRVPSCGDLKWNGDINIVLRSSRDGGRTWGPVRRIADFPEGESASDPSLLVDRETGEVFLFYNYMNLREAPDVYRFHLLRSRDNGETWSGPEDITGFIAPESWERDFKFITSGRGIQTSDGQLLHTMVNLERGLYVFGSSDHGRTWFRTQTPVSPADESKVAELPDGGWLVNSRVNGAGFRYIHISRDRGITWESRPDTVLTDPGCNAELLRTGKNGRAGRTYLLSHVSDPEFRRNLQLRISRDGMQTWNGSLTLCPGDAAYSSLALNGQGDAVVLFECEGYRRIDCIVVPRERWKRMRGGEPGDRSGTPDQ